MTRGGKLLAALAAVLGAAVLALLFLAYQQPGLLIDFTNLNFCG